MTLLQQQITAEQLRAVYKQLPTIVSAVAGAAILIYILKDEHPRNLLIIWLGLVFINCIVAALLYRHYIKNKKTNPPRQTWKIFNWGVLFCAFTFFTGMVWGSMGVIFYNASIEYKLFIVVWLWALSAGIVSLLVAYKPAFYSMILPLLTPLIIQLATDNNSFYHGISAATFLWMLSLMYFYHGNHKIFLEAISLRFHNAELARNLAIKNTEAKSAILAKSQFLAAASHDLRQPLHAQSLFLAELDQYVDNKTGRRILGGLESSIYAMRKLLNAILDISKLDAGTITATKNTFSISTIFINLQAEFKPLADEKNITLRIQNCSLLIYTDPILLERIMRNLMANAIRYTHKGKVLVGCRRHTDSVSIHVIDTGIGIANDKLNDVFIPFLQLGNPERDREKGLGLGLSIVQRTADLLGHDINLISIQNKGTSVSIDVPLSNNFPKIKHQQPSTTSTKNISGKRILIIDDDTDVRTAMAGLLKSWGCKPLAFQNLHDALKHSNQNKKIIDAILSDFNLSENTSGIIAIAELRKKHNANIPAALITGDTSVEKLLEAKNSHHPIIHKPVLANELHALISKLVE